MFEKIGKLTTDPEKRERFVARLLRLPRPLVFLLCCLCGWFMYLFVPAFRRRLQTNMRQLLGDRVTPREIRRFTSEYMRNIFLTIYEIMVDSNRLSQTAHWRFSAEGLEHVEEALQLGRGVIVYTPHVGNFFFYYWYLCQRYDCLTVVTAGSPELRPLYLQFQKLGCDGLDYDEAPPLELVRRLRRHLQKNGVVFLLGDFSRPTFPLAPIFGKWMHTPGGAASLALDCRVPIVTMYGMRTRYFRHHMQFNPPWHVYERFEKHQREEVTAQCNSFMETVIRRVPSQWLYWFDAHERIVEQKVPEHPTDQGRDSQLVEV